MSKLFDYLNAKSSYSPVWLTKDDIVFVSNETGVAQIWGLNLKTRDLKQYADFKERVWSISSNPTAGVILFTMDTGGDEQEQIYQIDQEGVINNLTNNQARNSLGGLVVKGNKLIMSSNERNAANFDIVSLEIDTGKTEIVIQNDDNYNTPSALSKDGKYLVYNKLKGQSDNCLWMADLENKTTKMVPEDGEIAKYNSPQFTKDSQYLYYVTDANSDFEYVCRYELATGKVEEVYRDPNWGIDAVSLSVDDAYLAILVSEDGYSKLLIWDTVNQKVVDTPELPLGTIFGFYKLSWSPEGHQLLFSLTSGTQVFDIWMLDMDAMKVEKLTHSSMEGIDASLLVEPILDHFTSFDGLSVPYWLYKPVGKELKDLAILIEIHGGPEGQSLPMYDPITQYLLSEGIAVVEPNVRGSTGYGKIYTHLDDKEKRLDSVKDIEYLVKHLVDTGIAASDKIVASGGSYGGFMALSCAARLPHLFCCAVDNVGMFNLVTFLENTSEYRRSHRESEYGVLATDREMLFNVSPVAKVDDIKGPLMVIHGANDPRVPVSEAEAVVTYLRDKGIEVEYLRYEDEGHGLAKLNNRLDCYPKMVDFLKKNMGIE